MTVTAVVGAQWGDEGKGRVVDYLAQNADLVVRFQGGDNAGHTVVNERGTFRLHLVPSGIFNRRTVCLLGTGMVVNPVSLLDELESLQGAGVELENLLISSRAHLVMPYHRTLDSLEEVARGGARIGTTQRGIGPAYADKAARNGLRMGDLLHPEYLRRRLEVVLPRLNRLLAAFGQPPVELDELLGHCTEWAAALGPRIVEPVGLLHQAVRDGKNILLEGQLGVMRDLDWGIYPYVTSSNPIAGGAYTGAGLPPAAINEVIGVVKAYSTCVGAGPFPVELEDENGRLLREIGQEYGATTGRPRRCGWLDGVVLPYATWLNGFTALAVTKLDVLDRLAELRICTAYRLGDETLTDLPDTPVLEQVTPLYETWPGWQQPTGGARRWDELPRAAQAYLRRIEELAGTPVRYVSVGAEREAMIEVRS